MRSDGDHDRLIHIRDNIVFAMSFVEGLSYAQFRDDTKSFYAVTRALEIVSEASRKVSTDLKGRHPAVPWKDMAGAATSIGMITKT